ncbi:MULTISPECIES: hypothetical protein [Metallosphaera]|uniref:Gins15 C-terminal domain-containing protein n=1 Tax=Metallosphaera cuprina (strain Ar-4) TaxID=1006006 RepID=F4G047_METCR|nr:hypothetical protein [Metallosphaera cuprina]AEB94546.1 conserved hypothetical protein [Metallosphaera cuprina Ar-4]
MKAVENKEMRGSFDSWQNDVISIMRETYVKYITGSYVSKEGKILCEVKSKLILNGKTFNEGDYVMVGLNKALALRLAGYVKPCEVNS